LDTGKWCRLVRRLKAGESLLVKVATGHALVIRRDTRDSNKFLFEEFTAPETKPYFVIHPHDNPRADGELFDGRHPRQRWRQRHGEEVAGSGI